MAQTCGVEEQRRVGTAFLGRGLLVAARDQFRQWHASVEGSGDPGQMIPPLNALAQVAHRFGDLDSAQQYLHQALALAEHPNAPQAERARVYLNMIHLQISLGRLDEAVQWVDGIAETIEDVDPFLTMVYWMHLAILYWRRQEWHPMRNAAKKALRSSQELDDVYYMAQAMANCGIANLELGLYEEAEAQLRQAMEAVSPPNPTLVGYVMSELGRLKFLQGDANGALQAGRKALETLVTEAWVYDKEVVAAISRLFGRIVGASGHRNLALKYLNRSAAYYSQLGLRSEWQRSTEIIDTLLIQPQRRGHCSLLAEIHRLDFITAILDMMDDLESVDPTLRSHSERVAGLAVTLGEELGLDRQELRTLGLAAWLHDVGKVAVDAELLHQQQLSPAEEARVALHVDIGADMLRIHDFAPEGLQAIRQHHQRFDSISADTPISLLARIVAVVNRYDRLTMAPAGRESLSHAEALNRLRQLAGSELDPELVEVFAQIE